MPNQFGVRVCRFRPAGESSDEDEYNDFMSDEERPTLRSNPVNTEQLENERQFQLFLSDDLPEVVALLDRGFDVNKRLRDDWTPLLLAASVGMPDITAELISRGADLNLHRDYYTPLMAAATCPQTTSPQQNSLAVVRQLLAKNVNTTAKTRKRMNALMFAASAGNDNIVKELFFHCDKMAEDNQKWTALFWAVNGNHPNVVKLLMEEGLPCDQFDIRGNLPIHYARENSFDEIIDLLPAPQEDPCERYVHKDYGYQDFFEDGRTNFTQDMVNILYGLKCERVIELFINNEINLLTFLTQNEDDLKRMNIQMPYVRYRIRSGLHRFHTYPFKTKSLPIVGKGEPYSTLNVANTILSACRQFVVMQASIRYILKNIKNTEDINIINKELSVIKDSLDKMKFIIYRLHTKAIEWDTENEPADLITKNSVKRIKVSVFKYVLTVGILSLAVRFIWKRWK